MSASWGDMNARIKAVEDASASSRRDSDALYGRVAQTERKQADSDARLKKLEQEVATLQKGGCATTTDASDPWSVYRAKHGPIPPRQGSGGPPAAPPPEGRDGLGREELSEEDRRTLVIGGWGQDTKRQIIQDEAGVFLRREDVQPHVDASELTVYGPRRSFGLLRFVVREGEQLGDVRDRMWKVIQALRSTPHRLKSVSADGKPMWAQFTKTREARKRSAHGSMLRRVCLALVRDAAHNQESHNAMAIDEGAYDVDWNSGTVWMGEWKLGSSVHRQPAANADVKLMSTGWVDIASIARALGVTWDMAVGAFEKEL